MPPVAEAAHPYYTRQLRTGTQAFESGDLDRAVRSLRLAAFGLLDEPNLLVNALSLLALAQEGQEDPTVLVRTLERILEVEIRFGSYAAADLPGALRSRLDELMINEISPTSLSTSAYFAQMLQGREEETVSQPTPPIRAELKAQRRADKAALREARQAEKEAVRMAKAQAALGNAGAQSDDGAAPATIEAQIDDLAVTEETDGETSVVPTLADEATEALSTAASHPEADQKLQEGRRLLFLAENSEDLLEALNLARDLADEYPEWPESQFLTGEIAYRASRWKLASEYFRRGGTPPENRPELLFYMAVAYFETGDLAAAVASLNRSLPNLQRTPFVETYVEKILGENRAGG